MRDPIERYREFVPATATAAEILIFARSLRGSRLRDVLPASGRFRESSPGDKGAVGQLVERVFRLSRSSEQRPDFAHAGIELKVVPLKRTSRDTRSKERTSVSMIDYRALPAETWESAKVRKKLESILFVFYHHVVGGDPLDTIIEEVILWSPGEDLIPQLKRDWSVVQRKVVSGLAHEISEGDGRVLGAATKGAGGGKSVEQPNNPGIRAKPRAWALKPALTSWIYHTERSGPKRKEVSLTTVLGVRRGQDFESRVIDELAVYTGRTLASIAAELKIPIGKAKSAPALLVRRAIGITRDDVRIREFEQRGVQVKTVPLSFEGRPFEAMSFPNFDHMSVIHDVWETSDLLARLERLLIIPLIRRERDTPKQKSVWGNAFFWSPTSDQLSGIQCEWEGYVQRIASGLSNELPGYAQTQFIHVRPHARNKKDTEEAPVVGQVVKKCFWLNPEFIARIAHENGATRGIVQRK